MSFTEPDVAGLTTPLDIAHHDQIERHEFGAAFPIPGIPSSALISGSPSPGSDPGPARADHSHGAVAMTWIQATPVFTVSGGWVQGNGTWNVGEYLEFDTFFLWRIYFTVGSTTTIGGTALRVNPPITPGSNYTTPEDRLSRDQMPGQITDVSAGLEFRGFWRTVSGTQFIEFRPFSVSTAPQRIAAGAQVTTTSPFTWATSDEFGGFMIVRKK